MVFKRIIIIFCIFFNPIKCFCCVKLSQPRQGRKIECKKGHGMETVGKIFLNHLIYVIPAGEFLERY